MKKLVLIALILSMSFALCGCEVNFNINSKTEPETTVEEPKEIDPNSIDWAWQYGDYFEDIKEIYPNGIKLTTETNYDGQSRTMEFSAINEDIEIIVDKNNSSSYIYVINDTGYININNIWYNCHTNVQKLDKYTKFLIDTKDSFNLLEKYQNSSYLGAENIDGIIYDVIKPSEKKVTSLDKEHEYDKDWTLYKFYINRETQEIGKIVNDTQTIYVQNIPKINTSNFPDTFEKINEIEFLDSILVSSTNYLTISSVTISPEKEIEFIAQALNFETSAIPSGITVNEFLGKTYVILNCIETDDFYYVEAYNKNGTQKCTFKLDEAGQEIIDEYYDDNEYIDKIDECIIESGTIINLNQDLINQYVGQKLSVLSTTYTVSEYIQTDSSMTVIVNLVDNLKVAFELDGSCREIIKKYEDDIDEDTIYEYFSNCQITKAYYTIK